MSSGRSLRVLHLVTAEEIFFKQQIEALEDKGIDCTVLVVPAAEQVDGAMAERRGIKEYLQFVPQVRRELRRGEYDLIHANYGLTAPFAVTQFQLPVVMTLWGTDVVGLFGLVTRICAWRTEAVTVRTKEMRDRLGLDDAYIIPSGIDMERFRPVPRTEARKRVGWTGGRFHILFPYAPEYERKNHPLAKRVVQRAEIELEEEITLHSISGVPHEKVVFYINAADVLLLTSRYEGSPNTVKEALACNVAVVSTDVGDVRERLTDVEPSGVGTTEGELVEHLVRILRSGRRSNGRESVRALSWDRVGDRLIDIYVDAVG